MKKQSKSRFYFTLLTLAGAAALFFAVIQTKKLYFDERPLTQVESADTSDEVAKKNILTVPKLKIYYNEALSNKKIAPQLSRDSEKLNTLDTLGKSITHRYLVKVISQQQNYLRRCYENYLRTNSTSNSGSVIVDFMVFPHGEIRDVVVKDSSFEDQIFENCVKTVFLRTKIKKFEGNKFLISFPLEFE